jgi:hypothetical protein
MRGVSCGRWWVVSYLASPLLDPLSLSCVQLLLSLHLSFSCFDLLLYPPSLFLSFPLYRLLAVLLFDLRYGVI